MALRETPYEMQYILVGEEFRWRGHEEIVALICIRDGQVKK